MASRVRTSAPNTPPMMPRSGSVLVSISVCSLLVGDGWTPLVGMGEEATGGLRSRPRHVLVVGSKVLNRGPLVFVE